MESSCWRQGRPHVGPVFWTSNQLGALGNNRSLRLAHHKNRIVTNRNIRGAGLLLWRLLSKTSGKTATSNT